jgi:hypothetical protein
VPHALPQLPQLLRSTMGSEHREMPPGPVQLVSPGKHVPGTQRPSTQASLFTHPVLHEPHANELVRVSMQREKFEQYVRPSLQPSVLD